MKRAKFYFLITAIIIMSSVLPQTHSPYADNTNSVMKSLNIDTNRRDKGQAESKILASNEGRKASTVSEKVNDPLFDSQWAIKYTESSKLWPLINQKREIRVAVVDSGVDYNHPDLKNRVLVQLGYDFYNEDKDPMDDDWHGTHVAGIIAAEADNGIGISGITGPLDVKIIPVKVLGSDGTGPSGIIARGIKYSVDKGADIINLSVDFDVKDELIADAIKYAWDKGVFVVVAAGNNNKNCDSNSPPADFGSFAVGAVDSTGERSYFSSYGNTVKAAAPGQNIISTLTGGNYVYRDGTSMAAPVVTGIAAMLKAEDPALTPEQLASILTETEKQSVKTSEDKPIGRGVVDAYSAYMKLMETRKE